MIRVLIVEDDLSVMLTLSTALRHVGYAVAEATNVADGLNILPHVDALITDGLDGQCWPILFRARELGKRVVLYSASDWLVETAQAEGFTALIKTAGLGEVLAALNPVEALK